MKQPWLVPAVWTGGLAPLAGLALRWSRDDLGANPVSWVLNQCGLLALIALLACLACTPLQKLFDWSWPIRIRKALGLLAFGYASLHFVVYVALDQGGSLAKLSEELLKRPFISIGFIAWLLLLPLALTSNAVSVRKLGFEKWKRLHRLAYFCGGLGCVHFIWRAKKSVTEPMIYAVVFAGLMLIRLATRPPKKLAED